MITSIIWRAKTFKSSVLTSSIDINNKNSLNRIKPLNSFLTFIRDKRHRRSKIASRILKKNCRIHYKLVKK